MTLTIASESSRLSTEIWSVHSMASMNSISRRMSQSKCEYKIPWLLCLYVLNNLSWFVCVILLPLNRREVIWYTSARPDSRLLYAPPPYFRPYSRGARNLSLCFNILSVFGRLVCIYQTNHLSLFLAFVLHSQLLGRYSGMQHNRWHEEWTR